MPGEFSLHERTVIAWPTRDDVYGKHLDEAREAHAALARTISGYEPVTMIANLQEAEYAAELCGSTVDVVTLPIDDSWFRDSGPIYVFDSGERVAGNWIFNGWGQQSWASWKKDAKIARLICDIAGVPVITSDLVNEGGGIHVNGNGVVLLTDTVQLGEGRNQDWTRGEVELEIHSKLGTNRAIWIRRGLTRDYDEFGTRGHIDIVCSFANESRILMHDQTDHTHPDFSVSHEVRRTLEEAGGFEVVGVPAPKTLRDSEGFVDYSYINHYLVNDGVILCAFGDSRDADAAAILRENFPGREVRLVEARPLFARGGGIHCITQQQPA